MAEYIQSGYIAPGYYESIPDVVPPAEGEYDLDVGTPGHPRYRTAYASTRALELAYWQPGSPFAPYAVQPVFSIVTRFGRYAWSDRGVPQAIMDVCYRFDTQAIELDPISFRSSPIASNVIGSVGTIERNQSRVVLPDPDGFWAKRIHAEAIVSMSAGLFWLVKGLWTTPALSGTVGRVTYRSRRMEIIYGDFRRDRSSQVTVRI